MAGYLQGPARWLTQPRDQVLSLEHDNKETTIADGAHIIDDKDEVRAQVLLILKSPRRKDLVYPLNLALLKATTSILANALSTPNALHTLQGAAHILGDLANRSHLGIAAFEVFHFYLMAGQINTARFVPKTEPYIPNFRSASGRYNFEVQATCILLAKRLQATRLIEVLLMEVERDFLHRELISIDFEAVEKANHTALDEFIVKWATTKKENPGEPAPGVLKSLKETLPVLHSTHVLHLLVTRVLDDRTIKRRNQQVVDFIQIAKDAAQKPNSTPNATIPSAVLPTGSLAVEFPNGIQVTRTLPVYPNVRPANPAAHISMTDPGHSVFSTRVPRAILRPVRPQRKRTAREVSSIDEEDARALGRGKREKRAVRKFGCS